ncbi:DUF4245 domain-containing protein [Plantactinospora sp. WMMB334]|uniref:DUF4245 domain-containing protein n=1 Tax=Plantactinospora sp. WMMB334 TaxID=3404119 RepID=UPI003B926707
MNSTAQPADRTPENQTLAEPAAAPEARADAEARADPEARAGADARAAAAADQVVPAAIRSQRSTRDIVISLLVLLVPIALVIGFGRLVLGADQPVLVDPTPAVRQARAAGAFPVSEPAGLGEGWRTVTADFRREAAGATLRIGYLSPDGDGVQLVQSSLPADGLLPAELTRDGRPRGVVELGGRGWQRYTARPGESALVLLEPDRTVLVVGQAPESELHRVVVALR